MEINFLLFGFEFFCAKILKLIPFIYFMEWVGKIMKGNYFEIVNTFNDTHQTFILDNYKSKP